MLDAFLRRGLVWQHIRKKILNYPEDEARLGIAWNGVTYTSANIDDASDDEDSSSDEDSSEEEFLRGSQGFSLRRLPLWSIVHFYRTLDPLVSRQVYLVSAIPPVLRP